MSAAKTCWGVYREAAHSPGRVDDDAAILKSVGEPWRSGVSASSSSPPTTLVETPSANMFAMCERGDSPRSAWRRWRRRARSSSIRPPRFATPTGTAWSSSSREHHVSAPLSQIVATDAKQARGRPTACGSSATISTRRNPTMSCTPRRRRDGARRCADSPGAASLSSSRRSMWRAIWSNSTASEIGARPTDANWFQWFYHRDKGMLGHPFDAARLREAAFRRRRGARARDLRRRRDHQGQTANR